MSRPPGPSRWQEALKSALDYAVGLPAAAAALPLLAGLALLVRLDSPGGAIYRRRVVGTSGRAFDAFKLRTMVVDGDAVLARFPELAAELAAREKLERDPRVTRVGHWLRRTSLDELPQLFNVLRGQMSLVGPRMLSPPELDRYGARAATLLRVKPGLTGLWQVSGRADLDWEARIRLDCEYVERYSLWRDLRILFVDTPRAVLWRRGAY